MNKRIAAKNLKLIDQNIIKLFDDPTSRFFVFEPSYLDILISAPVFSFELAVLHPCICLDFDSFWALRYTKNNNKWFINTDKIDFPEFLNRNAILELLLSCPPITNNPDIKEIMGVPVEYVA